MSSHKYIAVTGAGGFVGRYVCELLRSRAYKVLPLCRSLEGSSPTWDLSQSINNHARILEGVDAVIHLAAHVPKNYEDLDEAEKCYEINALGTLKLLRAAQSVGVHHFMHASTAALYKPSLRPVDEHSEVLPKRAIPYLASKLAAEAYVGAFSISSDMLTTVLRLAAVYGPGMSTSGLVPRCVKSLLLESSFQISDGNRFRTDLVHVSDVSKAILAILEKEAVGTFNIASGRILSPLDIANTVAELIGRSKDCIKVDSSAGLPPLEFSGINIENARYKLDYCPMSLSDGLADYINSTS